MSARRESTSVHPRACGEQIGDDVPAGCYYGSSPRVRGTGCHRPDRCRVRRFIPARAGNRTARRTTSPASSVHPRACGEQAFRSSPAAFATGSSPRVRGTVPRHRHGRDRRRFIPARAGNSAAASTATADHLVHPRACGEQGCFSCSARRSRGSSPRVRGTAHVAHRLRVPPRFIPARAGNSWCRSRSLRAVPVHPRACGEQASIASWKSGAFGSSPRVRGTVRPRVPDRRRGRFIPARAGNRCAPFTGARSATVHPRACGEQASIACWNSGTFGSSPRVRGTAFPEEGLEPPPRFIPARAGNSSTRPSSETAPTVHPRACGEQTSEDGDTEIEFGSSPRVRGTVFLEDVVFLSLFTCRKSYRFLGGS